MINKFKQCMLNVDTFKAMYMMSKQKKVKKF